jgi:hypothetical protein
MNDHPPTPDRPTDTRRSSVRVVVVSVLALAVLSVVVAGLVAGQDATDGDCLDTTRGDVTEHHPVVVKALYCAPGEIDARSQRSASQQSSVVVHSSSHQSSHTSVQSSTVDVRHGVTVQRGDDGGATRQSHGSVSTSTDDARSSAASDATWDDERVHGEHVPEVCERPRHSARISHVHSTVGGVSIHLDREQVRALVIEVSEAACESRDPLFDSDSVRETTVDTVGIPTPRTQRRLGEQQHSIHQGLSRSVRP